MKFDPPQLRVGGLSGNVYVITHGKVIETANGPGIEASRKYDVTEQFDAVAREKGWSQPSSRDEEVRERLEAQARVYLYACEMVIDGSTGEYDWKEKHEAAGQREAYNRILALLDAQPETTSGGEG